MFSIKKKFPERSRIYVDCVKNSILDGLKAICGATVTMGIIEDELMELKKCVEQSIPSSKLVACVPAMIRVELT